MPAVVTPLALVSDVYPIVREAHEEFVRHTAGAATRTPYHAAHSPGVVAYLREYLGRELPSPDYGGKGDGGSRAPVANLVRYWAFQGDPDLVRGWPWLASLRPGDSGWWMVSAHRDQIQPGDQVLIWRTGQRPGVVALAELTSAPHQNRPADVPETDTDGYWADLRFTRVLGDDLPKSRVLNDPILRAMRVVRGTRGSNFEVQPREWEALMAMIEPMRQLVSAFASAGLHYTEEQLATFLTALQTKGFVILSGISGTGKSKIAQRLAELLPAWPSTSAGAPAMSETLRVSPYMRQRGYFIVQKRIHTGLVTPAPGTSTEIGVHTPAGTETGRLYTYPEGDRLLLTLRGSGKDWLTQSTTDGEHLVLRPEVNQQMEPTVFHLGRSNDLPAEPGAPAGEPPPTHLFLPVRPDWRDSKPLLGYFNPLSQSYWSTEFLRFLQRAKANWDGPEAERVAFLVILDEMNLARVEYYFADLLSILESGRDADGLTKEAIKFEAAADEFGEADLPPDLKLPPNLYIVGTVNVDETTHGFSPKVLDRAFTIELNEVDFADYPPSDALDDDVGDATRRQVLDLLVGRPSKQPWAQITKSQVAYVVQTWPEVKQRLQELNNLLRPHHLHFGYRVFDEICAFIDWAEWNGLWGEPFAWEAAFDAAVLMKVLPKFHGSRGKLQAPLEAIRAWCADHLPRTAARVDRMLQELAQVGFTAFS